MSAYQFRVSTPQTGSYIDTYTNDPSGSYWKTVSEAREIVRARAPQGATVEHVG